MANSNGKPSAKGTTPKVKDSVSGAKKMKPTIKKVKKTEPTEKK